MKRCTRCLVEKEDESFAWRKKSEDKRHSHCRECNSARDREKYAKGARKGSTREQAMAIRKRNREFVLGVLSQSDCMDCSNSDIRVLEFDHVRGTKSMGIAQMSSYSIERIKIEIEKCDVVCSNCHKIRTYNRMEFCWRTAWPV